MQTNLEKKSIEARNTALVNNDYTSKDGYSTLHSDAISNGDPLGKGTLIGGHGHSIPNQDIPSVIKYENFDTSQGGGLYDIEGRNGIGGRNFLMNISKYNATYEYGYGVNSIDTSANEGQIKLT
jgi:hypothetical protein